MTNDKSILLEVYGHEHQDRERFDGIEKWMNKARAIKIVNGEKVVDFSKYDDFILKFLDEDRFKVQTAQDEDDASKHWLEAFDFFHTRHEYLHQLRHKFLCDEDADIVELRCQFKVVSLKFREIAERFLLACQLQIDLKSKKRDQSTRKTSEKQ